MSQVIDAVEKMRQEAIALLVAERQEIDGKLAQLGWNGEEVKNSRTVKCGKCGGENHTARTCKVSPSESQ